ncbi:MAG TPA: amidohydrolase family protein [Chloroflexota bacterium]|nr:amidohydrolase family protein [Chloroflexota bacterium]
MKNGMVIIDADGHAVDRDPAYRDRLPEEFKYRQQLYPTDAFDRFQNGRIKKGPVTPQDNIRDNDIEGIDLQVIYPTGGLFLSRVRDRDFAIAMARTYNDWLHDWCSIDRKRLKGVAAVPLHVDVRAAIQEMERAMGQLGAVGVMVNTYDRNRNVAHPDFWPFYEECARQGVAVAFHASGSDTIDPIGHFDNFLAIHTLSHAPEQLIACTVVIYGGLLEKYQDLRVAFLEAGIGWVPFWMEHMDEEYEFREFEAPLLTAKPSEYMANGRVFVSCEPEEKTLRYVPDFFPEDNILYASDYPHWDGNFPETVNTLANRTDISDTLKRKIFYDNPCRFYGLKVDPADYGAGREAMAAPSAG